MKKRILLFTIYKPIYIWLPFPQPYECSFFVRLAPNQVGQGIQGKAYERMSCQISSSWANLSSDLLLSIIENFDVATSDRLSAVCTSWASIILPCLPSFPPMHQNQSIPWLLCSARNSDINPNSSVFTFYDLSNAAYFDVQIPIPSLREHHWIGSYKGWLVTLDRQLQLHLIKPLTGTHVLLPCKGLRKNHPKKVIFCQNPDNFNELQAYCLTQEGLLFSTKLGDKKWSSMANYYDEGYQDIAVHEGKIYALTTDGICYWNLGSPYNKPTIICGLGIWGWTGYLLECKGELIMLFIDKEERVSLENHTPERVVLCEIKHGDNGDESSCSFVTNLGGDALFFGTNSSYVVSISSDRDDISENCIYFTNQMSCCFHDAEIYHPNHNFGIFDFNELMYYKPCCAHDSHMHLPAPIWFWP